LVNKASIGRTAAFMAVAGTALASLVLLSCGEADRQNDVKIKSVLAPSGKTRPPVAIRFVLVSENGASTDVEIEYKKGNDDYKPCSPAPFGYGTQGLASSPEGVQHSFYWNAAADLPAAETEAALRVKTSSGGFAATQSFTVDSGNEPPKIEFVQAPPSVLSGSDKIRAAVYDSDDAQIEIKAFYALKGGAETEIDFKDENSARRKSLVVTPDAEFAFSLAVEDLAAAGISSEATFAVKAFDALGFGSQVSFKASANKSVPLSLTCFNPSGIVRGLVNISCLFYGDEDRGFELSPYFRDPYAKGSDWRIAHTFSNKVYYPKPTGRAVEILWNSAYDLPDFLAKTLPINVRAVGTDARSFASVYINNAPEIAFAGFSEIFLGDDGVPPFIEIYGIPDAVIGGYAILEVRRDGQYDRTKARGFIQLPPGVRIPANGFFTITEKSAYFSNFASKSLSTFFKSGFPANILLIRPLDRADFFVVGMTTVFDSIGIGEFNDSDYSAAQCKFSMKRAQSEGKELASCPLASAAPEPPTGKSLCRPASNLNVGENSLDFEVCDAPTIGTGKVFSNAE